MSTFLLKYWDKIPIKLFFTAQVKLIRKISWGIVPLTFGCKENDIVEVTKLYSNPIFNLRTAQYGHTLFYLVKGLFLLKAFIIDGVPLTGNSLTRISFWIDLFSIGYLSTSFLRYKCNEFVKVTNSLFTISYIQSHIWYKFLICNTFLVCLGVIPLYGVMVTFTNIDPITTSLKPLLVDRPNVYLAIRIILGTYEIWNFALVATLTCFVVYDGMFPSYVALYLMIKKLHKDVLKNKYSSSVSTFQALVQRYQQIQIYTKMTNECYQQRVALPLKITVMTFAILLGVVLMDNGLRATAGMDAIILCAYTMVNLDAFLAVGYSFPGLANFTSTKILEGFRLHLTMGKSTVSKFRKTIRSFKDVRIGFGGVNYYEKNTAINILKFMIETTANLVLLV